MSDPLEPIIEWNMTENEAKAYKIGLIWLNLSRKIFPNYKHSSKFPQKGDPRKCSFFKHCHTLIVETNGLIPNNEYVFYVRAQLDILKSIDINGAHPRIEPDCLHGDKAWVRWKIWKRKYDALHQKTEAPTVTSTEVKNDLEKTKKHLISRFGNYDESHIQAYSKDIERWAGIGKITPYYILVSPWAKKYCKNINFDENLYKVSDEIKLSFEEVFDHEFSHQ